MPAHFTPPERDHAGEFRAKLLGGNNEIVTASEGYTDKAAAEAWPRDMLRWVIEAHSALVHATIGNVLAERLRQNGLLGAETIADITNQIYEELLGGTRPG